MKKLVCLILLTFTVYNLNAQNESINGTLTVKDLIKLNNSTNDQVFHIRPNSGYSGYIYWAENTVAERGILGFQAGSADLVYRSGGTSFSNGIERFRVKSNGNFGIGTTNPFEPLEVAGSGRAFIGDGGGVNRRGILFQGTGTFARILAYDYGLSKGIDLVLQDSGGKVGIGTTTPLGKVDILSATDGVALRLSMPTSEDAGAYDVKWANSNADIVHRIQYGNTYYDFMNINRATRDVSFNGGKVGIGTTSPQTQLEIVSSPAFTPQDANSLVIRSSNSSSPNDNRILGMTITLDGSSNVHSSSQKSVGLFAQSSGSYSNNVDMLFYTRGSDQDPYFSEKMRIESNGNVGIGTSNPAHELDVMGTIHATEVIVDLNVEGPDYVFEPDYNLKSLSELDQFLKINKHLPEVPSAAQMKAEGVNMVEMQMLLLTKVEELTLYLLEMKEENKNQQQEIELLKTKIN